MSPISSHVRVWVAKRMEVILMGSEIPSRLSEPSGGPARRRVAFRAGRRPREGHWSVPGSALIGTDLAEHAHGRFSIRTWERRAETNQGPTREAHWRDAAVEA